MGQGGCEFAIGLARNSSASGKAIKTGLGHTQSTLVVYTSYGGARTRDSPWARPE